MSNSEEIHPDIQQDQKAFNDLCNMDNFTIEQVVDGSNYIPGKSDAHLLNAISLAESLIEEEINKELLVSCHSLRDLIHGDAENYSTEEIISILEEILDGAVDSIYVILNLLNVLDLPFKKAWIEVQKANMAKAILDIDPSTGTSIPGTSKIRKREDGKILKPEGWLPPDIRQIVLDHYEKPRTKKQRNRK